MSETTVPAVVAGKSARPLSTAAVLAAVAVVELTSGITQGFLSPLLKALTSVLHVSAAQLNWLSIANLLASVAFTPVLSRLGDLYGHRRVLRWNLAIVLAGSLLVGAGRSIGILLVGQVLQGAFAGFFPLLMGILRGRGTAAEGRRGVSLMVTALVAGLAVGLLSSGLIARFVDSPTAALWLPAVAVSAAMLVTWPLLPESGHRPGGRVDWAGGVLLSAGMVAVMLGLGQGGAPGWEWTSARTLACLLGGVALLALWVAVERRTAEPMIDVRMFARRGVAVVSVVTLAFTFCMIGLPVANAVFLGTSAAESGYGMGLDPLGIAVASVPGMLALAAGALAGPAVARALSDRGTLVIGSLLMAAGYGSLAAWHGSLPVFLLLGVVSGVGTGFLQHSTRTLAVEAVPHDRTSVGSGINELLINVGGSIGAAVVLSVFAAHTAAGQVLPGVGAYTTAWTLAAGVAALGAALALLYRAPDTR
ncbi:MFS transporter [Kitasatospora sp. NPDC057015]|uniref:MFS transporter n=1 Tax=Kitasatospora sp. NPDC057015 TaxID=3346001 RepID=UPI0036319E39